jgi:hypothetical protein
VQRLKSVIHFFIFTTMHQTTLLLYSIIIGFSLLQFWFLINRISLSASPNVGLHFHLDEFIKDSKTNGNNDNATLFDDSIFEIFYNIESDGTNNLWDEDPSLPRWMKSYFNWHAYKRKRLDATNWNSERWLVMQCLAEQDNKKCGGTADRLKPILYMLRVAYQTQRILLIRWTRPATLEEFLILPKGGFDWRVPPFLADIMANETNGKRLVPNKVIQKYASGNMTLIRTRFQSSNGGADWYNTQLTTGEQSFNEIYHKVWRIFFTPSVPVRNIIQRHMEDMRLIKGEYVSAHLRALYAIQDRPKEQIHEWTRNAVNCASQLRPGKPIFFSSDSLEATHFAKRYAKEKGGIVQSHYPNPNPSLHLDRCKDWHRRPASDFYDTFVDLYLIALGECVTFNQGGFGHWGLLIGGKSDCFLNQKATRTGKIKNYCQWSQDSSNLKQSTISSNKRVPLFLEAVD